MEIPGFPKKERSVVVERSQMGAFSWKGMWVVEVGGCVLADWDMEEVIGLSYPDDLSQE